MGPYFRMQLQSAAGWFKHSGKTVTLYFAVAFRGGEHYPCGTAAT